MNTEEKPRKVYTREDKIEVVRLSTEGGIPVAQSARDLGLNQITPHNWRRQFREWGAGPSAGNEDLSLSEVNRRERMDNATTRVERFLL